METAEESDYEVLNADELWVDHSNVTSWEKFISSIEESFSRWNIADATTCLCTQKQKFPEEEKKPGSSKPGIGIENYAFGDTVNQNTFFRSEELEYEGRPFASLMLFAAAAESDDKTNRNKVIWENDYLEHLTPTSLQVLNVSGDVTKDFPLSHPYSYQYALRRWFGVEEFVFLQPDLSRRKSSKNVFESLTYSAKKRWKKEHEHTSAGTEGSSVDIDNEDDVDLANFLLSSASIALSNCNSGIPTFVPTNTDKNRVGDAYRGICVPGVLHGGATIYFETDICLKDEINIPESFQNLAGWLQFFKRKLQLHSHHKVNSDMGDVNREEKNKRNFVKSYGNNRLLQGDIFASVRRTYTLELSTLRPPEKYMVRADDIGWSEWVDDDVSWRFNNSNTQLVEIRNPEVSRINRALEGQRGVPLWGPLRDPIDRVILHTLWPIFREGTYIQNAVFSNLTTRGAPLWLLRVQFSTAQQQRRRSARNDEKEDDYTPEIYVNDDYDDDTHASLTPLASSLKSLLCLMQESQSYPSDYMFSSFASDTFVDENERLDTTESIKDEGLERSLSDDIISSTDRHAASNGISKEEKKRVSEMILELFLWSKETPSRRIGLNSRRISHSKQFQQLLDDSIQEAEKFDPEALRQEAHNRLLVERDSRRSDSDPCFLPQRHCRFCNGCKSNLEHSSEKQKTHRYMRNLKAAPPGSILSILALRMIPEFGRNLAAVALLWREFVRELRWHWENSIPIPLTMEQRYMFDNYNIDDSNIQSNTQGFKATTDAYDHMNKLYPNVDHKNCIIHQKLQLLNICIARKIHLEKHKGKVGKCTCLEKVQRDVNINKYDHPLNATDSSDDEEFFDAKNETNATTDSSSGDDCDDGIGSNNDVHIYSCVLETEDVFQDRLLMVQTYPELRQKLLYKNINSDIQSYKARFPDATVGRFKLWLQSKLTSGTSGEKGEQPDTFDDDELIDELWRQSSGKCLFCQKLDGTFNASAEAEKVLHHLETISPSNCLHQLFCVGTVAATFILSNAETKATELSQVKSASETMKERCRVALKHNLAHYSSIAGGCQFKTPDEKLLSEARLRSVLDEVRNCELLISKCTSLLNQFSFQVVERILKDKSPFSTTNKQGQTSDTKPNEMVSTITTNETDIRAHILSSFVRSRHSFYDTSTAKSSGSEYENNFKKLPHPNKEEYMIRCLANKPSVKLPFIQTASLFAVEANNENARVRCGANRMYVAVTNSTIRIATALTNNSF